MLLVPACGSSSGQPDAGEFCRTFYTAHASRLADCFGMSVAEATQAFGPDGMCPAFDAAIAAGRLAYDPAQADACLEEIGSAPCKWTGVPAACAQVVTPQVAIGDSCKSLQNFAFDECTGNASCGLPGDACTGTCVDRKPGSAGEACGDPGGLMGTDCQDGLYCQGDSETRTCQATKTSGPCTNYLECALPTQCAGPPGAQSCTPIKLDGAPCTPGYRECNMLSYCTDAGTCADRLGRAGDVCGTLPSGETTICDDADYCDAPISQTGTCQPRKAPGESCDVSLTGECAGSERCDYETGTCSLMVCEL